MSDYDDVGSFHRKFGLPYFGDGRLPQLLDADTFEFRRKFIYEELRELEVAYERRDLPAFFDALLDISYVIAGTAHLAGLPWQEGWDAVQNANMAKERASSASDSRSTRGHQLDVVKPAGWVPPDIDGVLMKHVRRREP